MTATVDTLRERLRVARKPKPSRKIWHEPVLGDFGTGRALAFDQSLMHTGWVDLGLTVRGEFPTLHAVGQIDRHKDGLTGYRATYERTFGLEPLVYDVIMARGNLIDLVLYEMPVVQGNRMESILFGGYAVESVCRTLAVPCLAYSKTSMASKLLPPGSRRSAASKKAVKPMVEGYLGFRFGEHPKPWNEHTRDAAALALAWLLDRGADDDR